MKPPRVDRGSGIPDWRLTTLDHEKRIAALTADCQQLREWLGEYGRHAEGCSGEFGDGYRCRCGWRNVLARLVNGKAKQTGAPRMDVVL